MKIIAKSDFDRARAAVLGALIGDAAGATLEFIRRRPTPKEVIQALQMTGGGVWKTAPGQVTDDGELTLVLCQALAGEDAYLPNRVAQAYRRWCLSEPFDIGNATFSALSEGPPDSLSLARIVAGNARQHNSESKANGSLMRATPLGVWSTRVELETAIEAARQDALLTHPNPSCQWSTAAYVVAIRHLMINPDDHRGAFSAAESILCSKDAAEVYSWLKDAREGKLPEFHPHSGYVRIAFTHAFHHLHQGSTYIEGLSAVLSGGGDTDTNACITGGLLGALNGIQGLPGHMRIAVLTCDVTQGQVRPDWLQTRHLDLWIKALLN
ncbi:MAG: ADP-ribosylglycohydrolase family protein [Zoogloea sp.]|nr:ADP-ribosylglycohydrolase family protein [Zoogloea sp.]